MKKLFVILFKGESENEKYSDTVCVQLSRSNLSADQEFCGIWGEIQFNNEECLAAIASTVNYFLNSDDKEEIYFGCSKKDYNDIISRIDTHKCETKIISCRDF